MLIAHKVKLFPSSEQAEKFRRCESIAKATYNQALRMWQADYQGYLREICALCASYRVNALVAAPRCVWPRYRKRAELVKDLLEAGADQEKIPKPSGIDRISKLYANRPEHWTDCGYWPGAGKIADLKDAADHFFKDGFGYPRPIKDDDICGFVVLSGNEKCGGKLNQQGKRTGPFARHVDRPVWQRPLEFHVPAIGNVRMAEPLRFPRFEGQKKTSPRGKKKGQEIETFPVASVTISRNKAGDWFASILCSAPDIQPEPPRCDCKVGVDLGVKTFAKLSDEIAGQPDRFPARKALKIAEGRLRRLQRKMSRQQEQARKCAKKLKDCKNYQKTRRLYAKAWSRVTAQRETYSHQVTTALVKDYPVIGIEDLRVRGMMAKGKPGNKRRKARLNRAIGDAALGRFRTQLEYKAKWHNRKVHYCGQFEPTTQICSRCRAANPALRGPMGLRIREWTCANCNATHDRDLNAATNIREMSAPSDDPSVAGKDVKGSKSGAVKPRKRRSGSRKSGGETPFDPGAVGAEQSAASAPSGQKPSENVKKNAPDGTRDRHDDADFLPQVGFNSRLDGD